MYPGANHITNQYLFPIKFWYNSSAVTFRDLTNLLADVNFNIIYFSDEEQFSQMGLVRVNNHIIVTTKEHIDDIRITRLVPFEHPHLKFLINSLKQSNRLECFISNFLIKEYQYSLEPETDVCGTKEQPI